MKAFCMIALFYLFSCAVADVYMHNPRGSNDRLNEANTDRNNANRLFDSQNNAKGGYCYGPAMNYYEHSLLTIQWTNQHACRNDKVYCNLVIQYMCSTKDADPTVRVRDGTTTNTITDDANGAVAKDNNGELLYGMHEPWSNYQACKTRQRNFGLWISDRETEGGLTTNGRPSSIFTRQNNNGNRHGYECAEERDYYPYWAPSPWKDVAILTNDMSYCKTYKSESQNVADKGYCMKDGKLIFPNGQDSCKQQGGSWETQDAWNIAAPDCVKAPFSRDNHLGDGTGGFENSYNWTLPDHGTEDCISDDNCNCVLRLRYNISTSDVDNIGDGKTIDGNAVSKRFIDSKNNGAASPVKDDDIVEYEGVKLQMAMDTTQFGRTFEDRSHVFHIKPRKGSGIPSNARVYNLNVRGKRGNIVQAYPATEYDYVPGDLRIKVGDYIHFQWTGCDTNPAGNAGEGTDQTDRSNIVQIENHGANYPASDDWLSKHTALFEDAATRKRMAYLDQTNCLTQAELLAKNNNNENDAKQDVQNCMKLNAAPTPYFDGGALQMNKTSKTPFYFMSSRNNNFSNRGQKGMITVSNLLPDWAIGVVVTGAVLFLGGAGVAGAAFYAKTHPHTKIAEIFSKM